MNPRPSILPNYAETDLLGTHHRYGADDGVGGEPDAIGVFHAHAVLDQHDTSSRGGHQGSDQLGVVGPVREGFGGDYYVVPVPRRRSILRGERRRRSRRKGGSSLDRRVQGVGGKSVIPKAVRLEGDAGF